MGLRTLVIIIGIVFLAFMVRRYLGRLQGPNEKKPNIKSRIKPSVDMVRCAHCGIHLPKPEALEKNGRHYCCREHRDMADS